jgi:hypothetical protein
MPRLNLSDTEVALIEKLRARNAKATGFNEGIQRGMDHMHDFLEEKLLKMVTLHEDQRSQISQWLADAIKLGQATLFMEIKS